MFHIDLEFNVPNVVKSLDLTRNVQPSEFSVVIPDFILSCSMWDPRLTQPILTSVNAFRHHKKIKSIKWSYIILLTWSSFVNDSSSGLERYHRQTDSDDRLIDLTPRHSHLSINSLSVLS